MISARLGGCTHVTLDELAELTFLGRPLPPAFERRVITLAPGEERAFETDDWHDAIGVVEAGRVELDCMAGGTRSFAAGSVLCLAGLPLRALCNRGTEPLTITALSRRR